MTSNCKAGEGGEGWARSQTEHHCKRVEGGERGRSREGEREGSKGKRRGKGRQRSERKDRAGRTCESMQVNRFSSFRRLINSESTQSSATPGGSVSPISPVHLLPQELLLTLLLATSAG
eukprot:761443-Hanusia_phi.AAC.2